MMNRYLFTPGPVPVGLEASLASARPMISHRCAAFHELFERVEHGLSTLLRSSGPVVIFPSSGTGALEALGANFSRPGTKALSVSCGAFGDRFREIFARFGATMANVDVPYGEGVTPEVVASAVERERPDVVLLTMNETSTGVLNPIKEIMEALPKDHPLVLVDGVSGIGTMPFFPEEWGVDGLATASQKGLLVPPGLGLVWLSPRAWERASAERASSYYFDLALQRKHMKEGAPENPYTPPVSLYHALDASLAEILAEPEWFALRARAARAFAAGLEALGYEMLVRDARFRSHGVTAFSLPGGDVADVVRKLRAMGVEPAGGQGPLKGKIIRMSHYHDVRWPELSMMLGALYAAKGSSSGDFMRAALDAWEGRIDG